MNPYGNLADRSFWAPSVGRRNMFDISQLWEPAFRIGPSERVATFGSCFAQHIGRALRDRGFNWYITERAPSELKRANATLYNYGIFSARTGNIYTASQLQQWLAWALDESEIPDEVWSKGKRFFDPFRPNIEPGGFSSREELIRSRLICVESFRKAVENCNVFVFTLGLTEAWINTDRGYEYPMCPGTVAGEFDPSQHSFVNQEYPHIRRCLEAAVRKIRSVNPRVRILLTVSPVPLTATMSGNHVLVATVESKSVLRAVAGQLSRKHRFVDYFPSYEMISAPAFRGVFFEPNQRSVNASGVSFVMKNFFEGLLLKFPDMAARVRPRDGDPAPSDRLEESVCEEELLGAFASGGEGRI